MKQKIGNVIDALGIEVCLHEGDMITNAIVIAKVVTADGAVGLVMEDSEGNSWLDQLGMMTAAYSIMREEHPLKRDDRT